MSNQQALDRTLDALGDPMRRRILERLSRGQVAVGDLAEGMPIGRPAVSRHLRVLTDAGLVEHTSRGTRNLYELVPDGQRELQQWLESLWDTALSSFSDLVAADSLDTTIPLDPTAQNPTEKKPTGKKPAEKKPKKSASSAKPKKSARAAHRKRSKKKSR